MAQQQLIQVLIFLATSYDYPNTWHFDKPAIYEAKYTDSELQNAISLYKDKVNDLPIQALLNNTGVKLQLVDGDTEVCSIIYCGESVKGWYAAYDMRGKKIIDVIVADIKYYEATFPQKDVETIAVAQTLEELRHQLGDMYKEFEQVVYL
jgi:hypothetical protein